MQITVKLYGSLCIGRFHSELREYADCCTILTIVEDLGISTEYLIRLKNGYHVPFEEVVQDGDTVSLLPMLDGG